MDFNQFRQNLESQHYLTIDPNLIIQSYLFVHDMTDKQRGLSALLLDGPPGTGKSYLAEVLAHVLHAERIVFQFVPGTRREDLLYDLDLSQVILGMAGKTTPESFQDLTSDGVLLHAARASQDHLVVLHLDEMDKASEKIDAFLLEFLQEGLLNVPHLGTIQAKRENLLVIMTKNDQRMISAPLLRRVRSVMIGYPRADIEISIITHAVPRIDHARTSALVTLANKLRQHADTLMHVPSTPELIRAAHDILNAPPELVGHVVLSCLIRYPDDRKFLKETIQELAGTFKKAGAA